MYIPMTFAAPAYDPTERERIRSGRPATQWEIAQRHHYESRMVAGMRVRDDEPQRAPSVGGASMAGIRRAISRALIQFGERISPEAA